MGSFRMPGEWVEHEATWLAWPYDEVTFPDRVEKVERVYCEMIRNLVEGEKVELIVLSEEVKVHVSGLLTKAGVDLARVNFHITDYADVWARDYLPSFVVGDGRLGAVRWRYNAYGGQFADLLKDDLVPNAMKQWADMAGVEFFEPWIVMEGGSIEVNGAGTLVTTEQCLLNPNRNPKLNRQQIEEVLMANLGVSKVIWIKEGITNDHTNGHIDDFVKFVDATTVLCGYEPDVAHPNHAILEEAYQKLVAATDQDGNKFKVVKVPMPHMDYEADEEGNTEMAPVSYLNFYIANAVVLVPTFDHENDAKALEIIRGFFPGRKVVGIDCRDVIYGGGAVHCVTQQQPKF